MRPSSILTGLMATDKGVLPLLSCERRLEDSGSSLGTGVGGRMVAAAAEVEVEATGG